MILDGTAQRSGLDDLGTRPDDGDEFHVMRFSKGHFSVVAEAVVAFVADDDVVYDGDVKQLTCGVDLLG